MSDTVAVIGLGLIGGSLARDLHQHGITVLGRDADRNTQHAARTEGVIDAIIDDDFESLAAARCVVIATPVAASIPLLERIAPHTRNAELITDTGSTKRQIERTALELGIGARFVGSHPFSGDHRTGWPASRTGLFAHERVYLCATRQTSERAVGAAETLWRLCGAFPVALRAAEHDALLARTSHLPQLTASALALTLLGEDVAAAELGRGGRDMVRLAASSPRLWRDIVCENRDNVIVALQDLQSQLASIEQVVTANDANALERLLERGRAWREAHGGEQVPGSTIPS